MNKWILLILFSLLLPFLSYAQGSESVSDMIKNGNSSFKQALQDDSNYMTASVYYSRAIAMKSIPSSALIYNLGNCLYLEGRYTEALIAYSRALSLSPGKREIVENLEHTRTRLNIKEPGKTLYEYIFWLLPSYCGPSMVWILTLLIPVLMIGGRFIFKLRKRRFPGILIFLSTVFCLLQFISVITWENHEKSKAFVIRNDSVIRKGDSPLFDSIGDFPPGTEIRILKTDGPWSRVRIPGTGQTGWIKRNELMTFEELIDKFQ